MMMQNMPKHDKKNICLWIKSSKLDILNNYASYVLKVQQIPSFTNDNLSSKFNAINNLEQL